MNAKRKTAVRCAIYARKSTAAGLEQAFNSLDAQREACAQAIRAQAHQGWVELGEDYSDGGFTGASLERPGFQKLLRDIDAGQVDVVVVYKVDRLSRSLLDFARVMERFSAKGVAFVSVTQNFSTADAMGRLTLNMLMSFAEFEREMIVERVRDKIGAARRKGRWTGGKVPFGYELVDRQLRPHPVEAPLVRKVFEDYLAKGSAVAVAETLNDLGVPLKNQLVPRPRPWTKDLVLRILRNRIYLGLVHSRGSYFKGEHEALVDSILFEWVQRALAPRIRAKPWASRNPRYLVRGALRCGGCGSVMTSSTTNRKGKEYRYYRCIRRGKEGNSACVTRQLPADAIETFVVEQLREAIGSGRITQVQAQTRLEHLREKEVELGRARQAMGDEPTEALQALEQQQSVLAEAVEDAAWLVQALGDFDSLWELMTASNRQRLVRALVEEAVVQEREGRLSLRLVDLEVGLG